MVASTIVILVAAITTTSAVVVVLLTTIGTLGVGARATVSVLRATHSLELIGHLRLVGLSHHHGWCAIHRHEGVPAVEPAGVGTGELGRIVLLLLRHSHAHVLLAPHHLLLKHRKVGGVVHVWHAWHRLRLNWLLQLLNLCLLLVFLIVFVLLHFRLLPTLFLTSILLVVRFYIAYRIVTL